MNQGGHITQWFLMCLTLVLLSTCAIHNFQSYRWKTDVQASIEETIHPIREQVGSYFESKGMFPDPKEIKGYNKNYISVEPEGIIKVDLVLIDEELKGFFIKIVPIAQQKTLSWKCRPDGISEDSSEYLALPKVCTDSSLNWTDKPSKWWWIGPLIFGLGAIIFIFFI
jgi:hypothetical protein